MALRDYKPKTDVLHVGQERIEVRGLNTRDLSILFDAYRDDLVALHTLWSANTSAPTDFSRTSAVLVEAVRTLPALVSGVIAMACGEPDATENAASLPFPVQLDAMVKIAALTFEESGGLGNFFASLGRLSNGLGLADRPGLRATPPGSPAEMISTQ